MLALPVLIGIYLRSRWSSPFPLYALALTPLSRQDAALTHLDSLPLMIWYSGLTALFLFLLARAAPAYLPTALSVALRLLFSFRQAQYVPVFPLKPAPFCTLSAGLGNTNKSATSPAFLLPQTLWKIWQGLSSLSSCFKRLQLIPGHSFLPGNDELMSWSDEVRYLRPPQSPVVSLLLPIVSTLVLSRTGGVRSH